MKKNERSCPITNHETNAGIIKDKKSVGKVCQREHLSQQKILWTDSLLPSVDHCLMQRKSNIRKR